MNLFNKKTTVGSVDLAMELLFISI